VNRTDAQTLFRWLDTHYPEVGVMTEARWPNYMDDSDDGRRQAEAAVLDLVRAFGFKLNPMDAPSDSRHKFMLVTMDEQIANIRELGGLSALPMLVKRLQEHAERELPPGRN
jgi:hypothetical protein